MTNSGPYEFPRFKRITVDDRNLIQEYTFSYAPYSDFNVLSLLCWNPNDDNSFSIINDNLVIIVKDYLEKNYILSVIGENKINQTFAELLSIDDTVKLVPDFVVERIDPAEFLYLEDRDSFDYIIETKSLSGFKESEYKTIRRYVNKFREQYPDNRVRVLKLVDAADQKLILSLTENWCESKGFTEKEKKEEIRAIEKFIEYSPYFKTISLGLFVGNTLIAFTLNELLISGCAMGHFGKALNSYRKSSYYLEVVGAGWLNKAGYKLLNLQQDTGLSGLRQAKMVFRPAYFLKKYTVKLAERS